MSEDLELQSKIAALAGRINRRKTEEISPQPAKRYTQPEPTLDYQDRDYAYQQWIPQRGTPYGVPRGRGRGYTTAPHRNMTLVVNRPQAVKQADGKPSNKQDTNDTSGWVTKRDRHMQLINKNVFGQKSQERSQAMLETRQKKALSREQNEKKKIKQHLQYLQNSSQHSDTPASAQTHSQVLIDGIEFSVADGGSKLVKITGENDVLPNRVEILICTSDPRNMAKPTPKWTTVGGVTFMRSKHGNLYRSGFLRTMRNLKEIKKVDDLCPQFSNTGTLYPQDPIISTLSTDSQDDWWTLLDATNFSTTGTCLQGPACRYTHAPEKVAICRDFLLTGKCQAGEACDLSHDPTPERVPACLHFLRNNCTNADCRYAHVRVNPGAPVCRAFAKLGYCSKGIECGERHVHECPDYANKGTCRNRKCRLPHVDRAGQLRKAAANGQHDSDGDEIMSDVDSDEDEYDTDDVDSDEFEEDVSGQILGDDKQELFQQADFVHL